ncbi:hypothetical protein QFZ74_000318 [Streptomyces sp. V3I7]|nr:hypothetical protein [Streptomyces sp. V3I7]
MERRFLAPLSSTDATHLTRALQSLIGARTSARQASDSA